MNATTTPTQDISVRPFSHTSTQGFYLVAGKERVATAVPSGGGWRLVWNMGQGAPITGDSPLATMTQALDAWPAVRATVKAEPGNVVHAPSSVATVGIPMGGQPGFRRR
ncbi:hypothetical protein OG301_26595 [Streptomyces platensis]|uniref:hypothetical protein n=1 Tax=Streptomyces platensis TaxID=58346 RepID=UPI002ED1D3A3|nr:hypothetical protein OG301_26595 [Streptomyces platensis]